MLQPKRTKHRKTQKMPVKGNAKRGTTLAFGSYGLKALDTADRQRRVRAAYNAFVRALNSS